MIYFKYKKILKQDKNSQLCVSHCQSSYETIFNMFMLFFLFNGISTFSGNLMPNPSFFILKNGSSTI